MARWSFGEATILRATALIHLLVMLTGLLAPAQIASFGFPLAEPAIFFRVALVAYGALGVALFRAVRLPRAEARLTVETVALVKLAFVLVTLADVMARKLPRLALVPVILDLMFGFALFRAARRSSPSASASA